MNKKITVTFEFDVETETTSNLTCFVDGIEKKKTTARKAKPKEIVLEDEALVTLEKNKIVFNNRCAAEMGLEWENRVIVKYEKFKGENLPMPIVGKDTSFDQEGSGNKVTKTNSIAYRGKANAILEKHGIEFKIIPYKEGIWRLISTSEVPTDLSYKDVAEAEKIDIKIITDEGPDEIAIEEMTYKL